MTFFMPTTLPITSIKRVFFENVDLDLHFKQGYLLQRIRWTDTLRSFWCKRDENRLNGVVNIQFLSVFSDGTSTNRNMETKLCVSPNSCRLLFVELEYLDHIIRKQMSNWLNSFRENWRYVFPLQLEKLEMKQNFGGKDILILSPHTRLRILEIFPARLRDPFAQPFKKRGGKGEKLSNARQNRNGGYLLPKPALITRRTSLDC